MIRHLSNEQGFTFVELLAALLLLGILVAIAIPNYFGATSTAQSKVDQSNVQSINSALALYRFQQGSCPPDNTVGGTFDGLMQNTTYFPDGTPTDPYCAASGTTCTPTGTGVNAPFAPYRLTYSPSLCRVQMIYGGVNHTTGVSH